MKRTMVVNCLVLLNALAAIGVCALTIQDNLNQEGRNSATDALWKAVAAGDVAGIRETVANGADLNETRKVWDTKGTPLSLAALLGYADAAVALLSEGASVDAREETWQGTPLHRAAQAGHVDVARVLLAAGSDIEASDPWQRTPIFLTAESERPNVAMALIAAGADVNAKMNDGQTALHLAAALDNLYTAMMLVNHGANVNAKDNQGRTPLAVAKSATADYIRSVGGTK